MNRRILSLILTLGLCLGLSLPVYGTAGRGVLEYSVVIPPQYEDAGQFADNGLAAVKLDGKWGYIDREGNVVLPFRYAMAYQFREGRAVVCPTLLETGTDAEGKPVNVYSLGFIDEDGSYTPFRYTDAAAGTTESVRLAGEYEDDALVFHNGYVQFSAQGIGSHLYDGTGHSVERGSLAYATGPMNEGLAPAEGYLTGQTGWIDGSGAVVKEFYPDWAGSTGVHTFIISVLPFNQGLAPVWQCIENGLTGDSAYLMGFMDRSWRWVIPPQFTSYWRSGIYTTYEIFGETGLAMLARNGVYGAVDKAGHTAIPFRYEVLMASSDGRIGFRENGKYGYLDSSTLEVAIPARYENATMFRGGLAVVYENREAYLIDRSGNRIPGTENLDPSTYFSRSDDGEISVRTPGEYVVISQEGKYGFGHITYLPLLPERQEMDSWAYGEVVSAIEADLVPADLQALYKSDITRGEFCGLVLETAARVSGLAPAALVQSKTGQSLSQWQRSYPFRDSSDSAVIAAYALGIVNGRGDGIFDPYSGITRQEAAVMLSNAARLLGVEETAPAAGFVDTASIAAWARSSVDLVSRLGVMNGTGGNAFSPLFSYTREQSFLTVWRLYQALS